MRRSATRCACFMAVGIIGVSSALPAHAQPYLPALALRNSDVPPSYLEPLADYELPGDVASHLGVSRAALSAHGWIASFENDFEDSRGQPARGLKAGYITSDVALYRNSSGARWGYRIVAQGVCADATSYGGRIIAVPVVGAQRTACHLVDPKFHVTIHNIVVWREGRYVLQVGVVNTGHDVPMVRHYMTLIDQRVRRNG